MTKKREPTTMSDLRRKRMQEVAAAGLAPLSKDQFDKLAAWIEQQPGHDEAMAEAAIAFEEYVRRTSQQGELRRRSRTARDKGARQR
jgi:hypothetical protein